MFRYMCKIHGVGIAPYLIMGDFPFLSPPKGWGFPAEIMVEIDYKKDI